MKLYWTTTMELVKSNPTIFPYNLKAEGMFISAPGTMIFRTRQEAEEVIRKAKAEIAHAQAAAEFDDEFYKNKEN